MKRVFVQLTLIQFMLLGVCSSSHALQATVCGTLESDGGWTWLNAPGGGRILLTTLDLWSYRDVPIKRARIQEVLDSFDRLHGYSVCVWGDRVAALGGGSILTVESIQVVAPQPRQLPLTMIDVPVLSCPSFFVR